ncbi:hypothetical protein [Rhizobium wuzhouense]|uniref:DUF768 domain-containing protein n=1 Tax=Rhizobium wuzhouense TaxID=1986026 RepID=A0ABX5NMI1_9HYPH|nr:hypothetical protein [Rhizobium wuzhouense]PYB71298.1 hypothetical protein DMY87_18245 [Rhizobium wuzhouense]
MSFNPCVVIDLRSRRKAAPRAPNKEAGAILTEAERLVDTVSDEIQAGLCNAGAGTATPRLGSIAEGSTLARAVMLCLELLKLRCLACGTRPADAAFKRAIEEWLYQRGNGNA